MADDYEYLSPDFDLNSLTVPRLRSILVSHDVPYPASAKKAQLIRILEVEVLPQAKKLLRERERVRRTSQGITNMPSREASVASEREYGRRNAVPTPSTVSTSGKRGRSKASTRGSTADTEDASVTATPSTSSRRTATRSRGQRQQRSETESNDDYLATPMASGALTPRPSTGGKLRQRDLTPSTEPELDTFEKVKREPKDDSVFTDDNPFQSGSSPTPWDITKSGGPNSERKRHSNVQHSMTKPPDKEGRPRKPETPMSIKNEEDLDTTNETLAYGHNEEYGSAGEEFTPDEQLALEREQADLMYPPRPPRKRQQKQGPITRSIPWLIIFSLFAGFGAWWRKEKIEIGFCGIGKPTWSLAETKVPEWASVLEPQCEPCPAHAFCYPNFEARCEHDFILTSHPLSVGGLIPLAPTCEPDSEKARRVKAVADKAVEALRDRRAKWECGQLSESGKASAGPDITETDLKEEVGKKRRRGMSDTEFDELWKGALGEIIAKEEVVAKTNPSSSVLTLTSTSVARLPLSCALRRYVRLSLLAYRLPLSALIASLIALGYARSLVLARRSDLARVPELVATTLDRLATQAALHARGQAHESYIPIGQLRDDVLRSELKGNRREEIWKRVRNVVEGNANVRAAVREGRGGDVARVWEWVGGIGSVGRQLDRSAPPGGAKVQFSSLLDPEGHSPHGPDTPTISTGQKEVVRRWDEGRPIY
ncbi:putative sister chromatid separation protein (Src1) [Aspergillus lucknowensis]|uniref:Man1-Src1p-C-terminal domain-containing protein n=1 Tax=Aspergillus lucknowensis TaxID=176173 RepID=A0ABR4M2C6_9EURO